jgi:curved DNA-binding protein CbpA
MSHYDVLGLPPDADEAAIKRAYRKAAQSSHPDREGGDPERFQRIQLAYDVLSDPERRERYDQTGESDKAQTLESQIDEALASLFQKVIDMNNPPANIIQAAMDEVRQNQGIIRTRQEVANQKVTRLKKLLGRVVMKAADGHNLFEGVLQSQIDSVEAAIKSADDMLTLLAGVATLLESYEDKAPEAEPPKYDALFSRPLYGKRFFNPGDIT